MSKEKFDLSNVGGKPKDWMQREHEKEVESSLGFKDYLGCAGVIAALVACVALFAGSFFIDDLPKPLKTTLISVSTFLFICFAAKEISENLDARRKKVDLAIENTWARLTRIDGELRTAFAEERSGGELREQKLLLRISHLEERVASLEQADLDLFGDDDRPEA